MIMNTVTNHDKLQKAYDEAIAIQDYWDSDMANWMINKCKNEKERELIRGLYQKFKYQDERVRLKPQQTLADLIKERDELKAHCESLRNYVGEVWSDHSQANRAKFIYKQTPQQSLAEIKAQAIEEAK
jgi:hypothetical protein